MTTSEPSATPPANTAAAAGPAVVVTGAASGLGAVVAERLVRRGGADVRAVDLLRGPVPGVEWHAIDVRDGRALAVPLAGAGAVVHLAMSTGPDTEPAQRTDLNVRGTRAVVSACVAAGVPHLVLVTSAAVFGARADNPVPIDDDTPLRAPREGFVGDLLEIEDAAAAARRDHPGLRVTVLRPAALVGAGADSIVTRHFASPVLLGVREVPMRWQFVHADDVASAITLVVDGRVPQDELTVGCEGWLSQQEVVRAAGLRSVVVPSVAAFATAERLHRAGVTPAPASELAFVVYPWVVASQHLRAARWRPAYDNSTALGALLVDVAGSTAVAGRVLGRRDATLAGAGVAGATAAVLGAAAFVRRARRLRGR